MATKRSCCIRFSCFSSASSDEKGQDPASASARSSPSAIDNTIETLPGAQAPIPGSSNVDVNLNVSGTHQRGKAPLSESLNILRKYEDEDVNVNLDDLMNHISELLKLREEETLLDKGLSNPSSFPWPAVQGLKKLNAILSWGTDLKNLKELLSSGLEVASELKDIISGPVRTLLNDIGRASVATAGLLVVANTLERFEAISTNKEKCWALIKEMSCVASVVKILEESRGGTQDIIKEATLLVAEGAIMCCTQIDSSAWKSFLLTSNTKDDLSDIRQKLNVMYRQIDMEIGFRVLTAIECKGRSPLSENYPTHAVGMDEQINDVLCLLAIESDQNVVTVILGGLGGMGKTTLADAVFSHVGGCKSSKVRLGPLGENIRSETHIRELQNKILKDLMGSEEFVPEDCPYDHRDGLRRLEKTLKKMEAFIYIDDAWEAADLVKLLPDYMPRAKKVRLLLTTRNLDVTRAYADSRMYIMSRIQHHEALIILKREIKDGINDSQFNDIIDTCHGIPLMLTLAAASIGSVNNKQEAYARLMRVKDEWMSESSMGMSYAFSFDALPQSCKASFLEICTYYNGWKWDTVEDMVGKDELRMLKSKALVGKTTNGFASVHDVILGEFLFRNKALSNTYPRHAVGITEPVEKVFRLLEIQSDDQNAVTVILHGFGGMGKTTLADAVFSEIGGEGMGKVALADAAFWKIKGGKRSKVRLFDGIKSTPDITALQKQILKDLMEPGETPPEISTHKDGQRALEGVLRKIHAFIYIDNVLEAAALEELLPQDMTTAKKVRLLLTARNEKVSDACPSSRTEPKFYNMQTIHDPEAMVILKREIEEGLTEDQFSDIIQICGGIPLMVTLAGGSIGHADNKEEAYARLKEQKGTKFEEMRYAFAYDTLPHECKDPFQDICTYFNGWNWDIVKDIVGDDALMMLKSRALVTRTTNGFASVHDVIIALAHGMSKEESKDKEVRCKFTNASELKKFLEEGDTEGITGIWLTERKEDGDDRKEIVVQASALDKMQKSLRVLQLGNSVKVEGNCNEIFKELCFFKANISRLPFTVSQLTQLRYLSYDPPNWVRSSLPSSLAIMNFDGKAFQTYN